MIYLMSLSLWSKSALQHSRSLSPRISCNHFEKITDWLKENVHHYAASKSMAEIVEEVSGEPFNPDYYTDYLIKKYKKLYNLD